MWDILIRARMSPYLVLADIQKAFLQVGLPFMLGATINYHLDHQPDTLAITVQALRQNTYVDNLVQISNYIE
jgi:hypothetical protein